MNLDCISQLLINAGFATALGVDIFQHHIPETAPDGSLLLKMPMDGVPINHYVYGLYKGRFQVIMRSKNHAFGDARAPLINTSLTLQKVGFVDHNGNTLMRMLNCYATTLPVVYPRSAGNEFEWSCNFLSHYLLPDAGSTEPLSAGSSAVIVSS